ncbi:lycopene cyclase domain-containing protein [Curtobacterium citreum]|uniref:lycopene cyclase domain-containing protein n=1 Tax=Curtobacterium citreum TaxID=2036 RepID=UPI00254C26B7|nr:lycopene cyclase domain-containing protein [Curtobacterium citreum]MDK8172893.1 lycopene cyclase domain-containing protein [Curtobacterium citreum]
MNATYALLALPFFAVVAVVAVVAGAVARRRAPGGAAARGSRRVAVATSVVAGIALLVMTIVFDNVIVGTGVVAYDASLISGLKIGVIPVEDLAYSIAAVVLLPSLWVLFDRSDRSAADRSAHDRSAPDRTGARPSPDPATPVPEETP